MGFHDPARIAALAARILRPERPLLAQARTLAAGCEQPDEVWPRLSRGPERTFVRWCDECCGRGRVGGGDCFDDSDPCVACEEQGAHESAVPHSVQACVAFASGALSPIDEALARLALALRTPTRVRWRYADTLAAWLPLPGDTQPDALSATTGTLAFEDFFAPLRAALRAGFEAQGARSHEGLVRERLELRLHTLLERWAQREHTRPGAPNPCSALLELWELGYPVMSARPSWSTASPLSLAVHARTEHALDLWLAPLE